MSTNVSESDAPTASSDAVESSRTRLVESIFDNLMLWTVLAAAISFLFLVWATLDVLSRYIGWFPKVGP